MTFSRRAGSYNWVTLNVGERLTISGVGVGMVYRFTSPHASNSNPVQTVSYTGTELQYGPYTDVMIFNIVLGAGDNTIDYAVETLGAYERPYSVTLTRGGRSTVTVPPDATLTFSGTGTGFVSSSDGQYFTYNGTTVEIASTEERRVFTILIYNGIIQADTIWDGTVNGLEPPPIPGGITDLVATALSSTAIGLVWTGASDATSHQFRRRVTAGPGAWTDWANTNTSTTHGITGLSAETGYDTQVRGVNITGAGDPSNTDSATTFDVTPAAFDLGPAVEGEPDEILYSNEWTVLGVTAATAIPATLTGGHGGCCRLERYNGSTWDNLGASADLYLNDQMRARTRAHTTTDTFILTVTVGGVTDTLTVNTVEAEVPADIAAPILVQTSAAGATPFQWSIEFPDSSIAAGMFIRTQTSADGLTEADGSYTTPIQDLEQQLVPGDFVDTIVIEDFETPVGLFYLQQRIEADDGTTVEVSPWSNELASNALDPSKVVYAGHSITDAGVDSYGGIYRAANPSLTYYDHAAGGNDLADIIADLDNIIARGAAIVALDIGANDYPADGEVFYDAVMDGVVDPLLALGTTVVIHTILPQAAPAGSTTINAPRAVYNALLRTLADANPQVRLCDWDNSVMGPDAAALDTTLYGDGIHPTDGTSDPAEDGHEFLALNHKGAMDQARGIAREVAQFTFVDQTGVTASTLTGSNAVRIQGLAHGETKPYSSTDGARKTPFGGSPGSWETSGFGTLANGDLFEVRGTSDAGAGEEVDIVGTVGGVSDTFTLETLAGGGSLTTTFRSADVANGGYGANHTFSSVAFYAGKNIIAITASNSAGTAQSPTGILLGGTAGTMLAEVIGGGGRAQSNISYWEVPKASGGSGNLVITIPIVYSIGYGLWSTDADAVFVAEAEADFEYYDDPLRTLTTIAIPSGGDVLIAVHAQQSANILPETGTTEQADEADGTTWKHWYGQLTSGNQPGVTGIANTGSSMLAISLEPA